MAEWFDRPLHVLVARPPINTWQDRCQLRLHAFFSLGPDSFP
jgi:hypothetical protein